jgi:hypothetical protein
MKVSAVQQTRAQPQEQCCSTVTITIPVPIPTFDKLGDGSASGSGSYLEHKKQFKQKNLQKILPF